MRVLVVSENPSERARASSMLRATDGVEVLEAASASEGKAIVLSVEPDVLVVDGNLAPQGGYSFVYELRQHSTTEGRPAVPALLLTTREHDAWLAGWAAADATLPLPADPFDVARVVTELGAAARA